MLLSVKNKRYILGKEEVGNALKQSNSDISINGFEKNTFPDSFFDIAVGNVPFGNFQIADNMEDGREKGRRTGRARLTVFSSNLFLIPWPYCAAAS